MRAIRIHEYGGPEVLTCEEIDTPVPGDDELLVEVKAAAVNPIDVAVRENRFPTPLALPKTIGSDGAGVVAECGPGAGELARGTEVMFTGLGVGRQGSYAEYAVIHRSQAVVKPAELGFEQAAAMGLVFPTAYYGLVERAGLRDGETVLVQGAAGGVGGAAVQLAHALGARVIAVVSDPADGERVVELGAGEIVDRHEQDVAAEARRLTDGRGVDVIIEIATTENLRADLGTIAKGGRVVCIGQGPGATVEVPVGEAIGIDATVLFSSSSNAGRAGMAGMLSEIAAMAADGRVSPVVGATLPLTDATRAHELLAEHHFGKIVLVP